VGVAVRAARRNPDALHGRLQERCPLLGEERVAVVDQVCRVAQVLVFSSITKNTI
jgi:hypothetical protein